MEPSGWKWNEDFLVFEKSQSEIILKNDSNGAMVRLSEAEYELLQWYSANNDYKSVCRQMHAYHIEKTLFDALTGKARQLGLLVEPTKDKLYRKNSSGLRLTAHYLFVRFIGILSRLSGMKLLAECNGNLRFFKLCSLDLTNTVLQKMAVSKKLQAYLLPVYIMLMTVLIAFLVVVPGAALRFSGFGLASIPVLGLFLLLVLGIFCCLFVHEIGHYFCFKRYGGKSDSLGIGLMFMVFPVMYTKVDQVHLWQNPLHRIKLSLAGILMDFMIMLLLLNVLTRYHTPNLFSLIIACLFYYYVVQILSNLNVFFPGTDGYYVFEDILGIERLFGKSFETFNSFLKQPFLNILSLKTLLLLLYFLIACINISLYWLLIAALMTFPIWSKMALA